MTARIMCLIFFVFGSCFSGCVKAQASFSYVPYTQSSYKLTSEDEMFLDSLQYRTFLYFVDEINKDNGLVKDRSAVWSPASMAAAGFALACWGIGAERQWITRQEAAQLTVNLLRFLMASTQSPDTGVTGYKGFYYHFVDMQNGRRFWKCELSSIDTAWLLAGIRFAMHYFSNDNDLEDEIREKGELISKRVDWSFMQIPDNGSRYGKTISLAWHPEEGLSNVGWIGYNEAMFIYILATGMGYEPAAEGYKQWLKSYDWLEPYQGLNHSIFPPLFGHQYSHMFLDLRGYKDEYMAAKGIDYFENSRRAVYTQRAYAMENPGKWGGYDSLCWGLTACDGPGSKYNSPGRQYREYEARGTSGKGKVTFDDGTIAPTAAATSIAFAPEIVIPALKEMKSRYGDKGLWGKYGFKDAFNPTLNWYDTDYLGIDQAPIVIMIENFRTGLVWKYLMQDEVIKRGLKRLGFHK